MKIDEAINTLQYLLGYENAVDIGELEAPNNLNSQEKEALRMILEEIQQYRAIGTVGDIKKSMQNVSVLLAEHEVLKLYQSIGTIDEFKALKEKNVSKKIKGMRFTEAICPECETELFETYWAFGGIHYCSNCGQKIDWSE